MGKGGSIWLLVVVAACGGGDDAAGECTPGDQSRLGYGCSVQGKWVQETQQRAGGPSSNGGAGGASTSTTGGGVPGSAGGAPGSGTGGGSGDGSSACLITGSDCSGAGQCCSGSTCVRDGSVSVCAALCVVDEDCASQCCAPLAQTGAVCAPADYCSPPVANTPGPSCVPVELTLGFYDVTVSRQDNDLYSFTAGVDSGKLETQFCFQFVYFDPAELEVTGFGVDKLHFSSGSECDVVGICIDE